MKKLDAGTKSVFKLESSNKFQYSTIMKKILNHTFQTLHDKLSVQTDFDIEMSGCTLNIVVVTKDHIMMANCGDSRSILIGDKGEVLLASRDHKPDLVDEKSRIEFQYHGRVKRSSHDEDGPMRVFAKELIFPGLAMSRSIGD